MDMTEKLKRSNFMYDFLTARRFRVYRHLFLFLAMGLVALNQIYILWEQFSWIFLALTGAYMGAVYFNLYVLTPRYLFAGKYIKYLVGILLYTFLLIGLLDLIEYRQYLLMKEAVADHSVFHSQNSFIADLCFTFPQLLICIASGSSLTMLRDWRIEHNQLTYLKKEYLETELEQLKDRISPDFLCNTLHKAGMLSETDPEQTSRLLVGLSRVLRYQLYDCVRDEVLLPSEFAFVERYLELYRMCNPSFNYQMTVSGTMDRIFVPPLLFLPLIRLMNRKSTGETSLQIDWVCSDTKVGFICSVDSATFETIETADLADIQRRLGFLYGSDYQLTVNYKRIVLQLKQPVS